MGLKEIAVLAMITKERLLEILDKSKPEDKVSFYTEIALSSLIILKYKPFKKYLVSSFDIANFVLSINLKIIFEFIVIVLPKLS